MSKAVKAVTRPMRAVLSGVNKLRKKVVAEGKRFAKSDLGKMVITAALVYFGGAAIAGMSSGAGAMAGLQGAWTSLGTAGSAAMAGNFSGAASALGSGFGGTAMTGTQLAASQAAAALPAAAQVGNGAGAIKTMTGLGPANLSPVAPLDLAGLGGSAPQGMLAKIASSPYLAPSLVIAGSGMLTSIGQGKQMEAMQEREDEKEEDRRRRYNTNAGARLWG
jgi:hypothetical protein